MTKAVTETIYKLIEAEEDKECNIFSLPIQLIKNRAEQFLNEPATKILVNTHVRQKEVEKKRNAMGFNHEIGIFEESLLLNSYSVPKRRRAKAPEFFLASQSYSNLKVIASKAFLIEVMKGHLLYDYTHDNFTQRHTPFEKTVGYRLKGIAIAIFADKTDYIHCNSNNIVWKWEMRSRNDILEDLTMLVPNADYSHAVLRYCLPHYNSLNTVCDLPVDDYVKALDGVRDASLHACSRCGLEFPLAYSKQVLIDSCSNDEKDLFFCLYCTSIFNKGSTLLPQKTKETIMVITRLLKEYTESRYRSPISFTKNWELQLLSTKRPYKKKFVFTVFGGLNQMTKNIREELSRYKTHYFSNDVEPSRRIPILRKADSFLRDVMFGLREAFSPLHNRIHNELLSWRLNEGVVVFSNTVDSKSTEFLPSPSHTTSLLISLADNPAKNGFAKWMLVPPLLIDKMVYWMNSQNCTSRTLSIEEMDKAAKLLDEIVVYKQQPGEVVTIPVGWAYCIYHNQPSLQLSFDWIEQGSLHLCTLSYIHCWRQLTNISPKAQPVEMNFMSMAMSKLPS